MSGPSCDLEALLMARSLSSQAAFERGATLQQEKKRGNTEESVKLGIAKAIYANALAFHVAENYYFRSSTRRRPSGATSAAWRRA